MEWIRSVTRRRSLGNLMGQGLQEIKKCPKIDVQLMGEIKRVRNVLLGTFLRDYQDLCSCNNGGKDHYFSKCDRTVEFREMVNRKGRQSTQVKL